MQSFRKMLTLASFLSLCVGIAIGLISSEIETNTMVRLPTLFTEVSETLYSPTTSQLPEWLQILNLDEGQTRRVFEIDELLEQRLQIILTTRQYSQWQASQRGLFDEIRHESWNFSDINIDLSPYQQLAVDAVFRDFLESVLGLLSEEQMQQLQLYLTEENAAPASGLDI